MATNQPMPTAEQLDRAYTVLSEAADLVADMACPDDLVTGLVAQALSLKDALGLDDRICEVLAAYDAVIDAFLARPVAGEDVL